MGVFATAPIGSLGGTPSGGFSKFKGFGASSQQFDLNSPDGLLTLAQMQGGAVAQAANEIAHPTTGILSTIGSGFKNAFSGFVEIISTPGQIVAGGIDSIKSGKDLGTSVGAALKNNTSVSDVIFGAQNKDASTMEKVGSFLVRTAVDILSDPLTYVTFGAGTGILGLRATSQIALGEKTAALLGKNVTDVSRLSAEGQNVYKHLKSVERQMRGSTAAEIVRTGDSTLDDAGDILGNILKHTIDSKLSPDYAKKAMTNLLEKNPDLANTLLDKGGIKFFGKTILSGQRIGRTAAMLPGMTLLDDFTRPARTSIQALFNPSLVKVDGQWQRLPQEYLDLQQSALDLANSLGDDRVRKLMDVVSANKLSSTEARYLTAAVEAGKIPSDERLASAYKQLLNFSEEEFDMLKGAGVPISRLDNHVPHILVKNRLGSIPFMPLKQKVGAAIQRTKEGPIFKTDAEKLAKLEEAALAKETAKFDSMLTDMKNTGFEIFDDNIITALTHRSLDNTRSTTMRHFMQDLAESFGGDASIMDKFVPIKNTAINKEAENLFTFLGKDGEHLVYHPAIAARVEEFSKAMGSEDAASEAWKAFDSLQNLWKASVTSIFPAFHGRNAISNVFLNMLDLGVHALNPRIHTMSGQMIMGDIKLNKLQRAAFAGGTAGEKAATEMAELMQKTMFTDATGYKWSFGELRQVAKDHNVAFTSRILTSSDVAGGPETLKRGIFTNKSGRELAKDIAMRKANPLSQEFKAYEVGRTVGSAIENQARLVNFIANLRNTGDVMLAAKRTKQFLFDYNALTNFERSVLRRIIPFYTFTRKNLELQVKTLMTTPGRTGAQITAVNNLGEAISGGAQLTDEERAALPDWVKTGINVLTKKKGETVNILSSFGTPIEAPFQQLQSNVLLGSVSPLIRVPVEQMSGHSFFQGKPLSDVTNAAAFRKAPGFLKGFIGYTELEGKRSDGTPFTWYVSLHPERMNLVLNLPPTSRVFSALKQMDAVDVAEQAKIIQFLTGVRPYSFDLQQEASKRQREMKSQLEDILTKAGVTAKFQTTYLPKQKEAF